MSEEREDNGYRRDHFITRHSIKPGKDKNDPESERYHGITQGGEELARESAKNIAGIIGQAEPGTVMFLGGVSDEIRTASTARVYGDELKRLLAGRKDYLVVTEDDILRENGKPGVDSYQRVAKRIKSLIDSNKDKKILIDIPIFLKEFSSRQRPGQKGFFDENGKPNAYAMKILEKGGGDEYEALKYWIKNNGKVEGMDGPKPEEVAKKYAKGISRLEKFVHKYVGNRHCITGLVGHSWEADTYLAYLAGNGKVDVEGLEKVAHGGKMIKETEMAYVQTNKDMIELTYRGGQHRASRKTLEQLAGIMAGLSLLLSALSTSGITGNVIGENEVNIFGSIFIVFAIIFAILFFQLKKHPHKEKISKKKV